MAASNPPLPVALFGVETEYALSLWNQRRKTMPTEHAAEVLLQQMRLRPRLPRDEVSGFFLSNGGRFYVDCGAHPEYCTPEVTNPTDVVRHVAAGDRMLGEAVAAARESDPRLVRSLLTRSNVDFSGSENTWGQHESYLCRRHIGEVANGLVPHMTTRIVYSGAGGFDNRGAGMHFVLSPRAMHLCAVISPCSTDARGIIHTRDESLSNPPWHRLHMTYGEALCSQLALFLKVGTTSLVVLTLDYNPQAFAALALADPLAAAHAVARDPSVRKPLRLADGRELGVVDIQRGILEVVERYAAELTFPDWTDDVCRRWRGILDALSRDPMETVGKLDWTTKLALYRDRLERAGFTEDEQARCNEVRERVEAAPPEEQDPGGAKQPHPARLHKATTWYDGNKLRMAHREAERAGMSMDQLQRFDLVRSQLFEVDCRFAALGDEGIFETLDCAGVLSHRIVSDEEIARAMVEPPQDTRARRRGRAVTELADAAEEESHCGWTYVVHGGRQLALHDPLRHDVEWEPRAALDGDEPGVEVVALP